MSAIVESAIARAGLSHVLAARARGDLDAVRATSGSLADIDLLVLGALADRVRAVEVGEVVRIYANVAAEEGDGVVLVTSADEAGAHTGLGFLRAVALARITGPRAARVRVDWASIGLELAQVALGFGASELVGAISTKRGLPIADGTLTGSGKKSQREELAAVKRRELAGFVRRSGRRPIFVTSDGEHEEPIEIAQSTVEEATGDSA